MAISNERMKLIEKVMKLLALADGTNYGEEAETARRMAAELMAKNNIALSDMVQKEACFLTIDQDHTSKTMEKFDSSLINLLAKFNNVFLINITNSLSKKFQLRYVGRAADIEVTQYMTEIVKQQRKVAYAAYTKEYIASYGKARWDKDYDDWRRWMNGFNAGLKEKLDTLTKMSESKVQEWGLVPVSGNTLAVKWYHENVAKTKKGRPGKNVGSSKSGYIAGKNTSIHTGIGGTNGNTKMIGG